MSLKIMTILSFNNKINLIWFTVSINFGEILCRVIVFIVIMNKCLLSNVGKGNKLKNVKERLTKVVKFRICFIWFADIYFLIIVFTVIKLPICLLTMLVLCCEIDFFICSVRTFFW